MLIRAPLEGILSSQTYAQQTMGLEFCIQKYHPTLQCIKKLKEALIQLTNTAKVQSI